MGVLEVRNGWSEMGTQLPVANLLSSTTERAPLPGSVQKFTDSSYIWNTWTLTHEKWSPTQKNVFPRSRNCLRHSCLEKMSPSLPPIRVYLQRSTHAAESFKLVPGKMWGLAMIVASRGVILVFLLFSVWIQTHTKALIFSGIPFYFSSVCMYVSTHAHTCSHKAKPG